MKYLVEVREEHYESGKKYSASKNPVALAIQDALHLGITDICMGNEGVFIGLDDGYIRTALPPEAIQLVSDYDIFYNNGGWFHPFTFELEIPDKYNAKPSR